MLILAYFCEYPKFLLKIRYLLERIKLEIQKVFPRHLFLDYMFFPVGNRLNHSRERIVKDVPQAITAAAGPYLASAKWTDKTAGR